MCLWSRPFFFVAVLYTVRAGVNLPTPQHVAPLNEFLWSGACFSPCLWSILDRVGIKDRHLSTITLTCGLCCYASTMVQCRSRLGVQTGTLPAACSGLHAYVCLNGSCIQRNPMYTHFCPTLEPLQFSLDWRVGPTGKRVIGLGSRDSRVTIPQRWNWSHTRCPPSHRYVTTPEPCLTATRDLSVIVLSGYVTLHNSGSLTCYVIPLWG